MTQMREYYDIATADLERSLALTEKPYLSHRYLLTISRYLGGPDAMRLHYEEAIRWAPQRVETRLAYMKGLEPRWGGSYAAMEGQLADSRAALSDPQAVRRLAARIPASRGHDAHDRKDYLRALSYYDEASELDAAADILCARALELSYLKRNDESLTEAGRALALNDPDNRCVGTAVHGAARASNADDVIALMTKVIEIEPSNHDALVQRGFRYRKANKPELAFDDYLKAARLGNSYAQYEVSSMYWQGLGVAADSEQAVLWMRKADEQGNAYAKAALERYLKALGQK
jgi:TPR repeat protein